MKTPSSSGAIAPVKVLAENRTPTGKPPAFSLVVLAAVMAMWVSGCAHSRKPAATAPPSVQATAQTDVTAPAQTASSPTAEAVSDEIPDTAQSPQGGTNLDDDAWDDDEWEDNEDDLVTIADPIEGWNRGVFYFNDKLYFWVLKPVTRGYRVVVPVEIRGSIKNFFTNLAMPIRLVNSLLQGEIRSAGAEVGKFFINTTVGVLGLGDPAADFPALQHDAEDMGQTFGRWGLGDGFFIVWPVLGASSLRDSVGKVGDIFLDPIFYAGLDKASIAIAAGKSINTLSFRLGDYEALKKAALDPYQAMRNAYIQLRTSKIAR